MTFKPLFLTFAILLLNHFDAMSQSKVERVFTNGIFYHTDFITFKNRIFFTGSENGQFRKPYVSDGTTAGTKLLKNITIPEKNSFDSGFKPKWTISGDKMFFVASDSLNGQELWLTDGTENGTRLVKNISPKDTSTYFYSIHSLPNGKVYISVVPYNQPLKVQLWISDGTEGGTMPFFEASTIRFKTYVFKNQMYYYYSDGLWQTDGTANGTKLIKNLKESDDQLEGPTIGFAATPQKMFFITHNGLKGVALWASDGTTVGTQMIGQGTSDTLFSGISNLTSMGDKVFFSGYSRTTASGLWVSDGTQSGTKLLKKLIGSSPLNLTVLNGKLLFTALDSQTNKWGLWISDGTESGTFSLRNDFSIGDNIPSNEPFYTLKNKAYFTTGFTTPPSSGISIFVHDNFWETDGTSRGTDTLRSFPQNNKLLYSKSNATVLGDKLYLGLNEENIGGFMFSISNSSTSIKYEEWATAIQIYPTLANDWLFIESADFIIDKITIIDLLGRTVFNQKNFAKTASIPLSNLLKNGYLIRLETSKGVVIKKFFKL